MKVRMHASLLTGERGDRIHASAAAAGWIRGEGTDFLNEETSSGVLELHPIPSLRQERFLAAHGLGVEPPQAAISNDRVLLDDEDGISACPEEATLVAGDLLRLPGESQTELYARILSEWDWWMEIRSQSREMAVSWGDRPDTNLLLLFNGLDAGYLDEPIAKSVTSGKVRRIVGFHPITTVFGRASGLPVVGCRNDGICLLIAASSPEKETFWKGIRRSDCQSQ